AQRGDHHLRPGSAPSPGPEEHQDGELLHRGTGDPHPSSARSTPRSPVLRGVDRLPRDAPRPLPRAVGRPRAPQHSSAGAGGARAALPRLPPGTGLGGGESGAPPHHLARGRRGPARLSGREAPAVRYSVLEPAAAQGRMSPPGLRRSPGVAADGAGSLAAPPAGAGCPSAPGRRPIKARTLVKSTSANVGSVSGVAWNSRRAVARAIRAGSVAPRRSSPSATAQSLRA